MIINVRLKKLGRKAQTVGSCPYELPCCPETLRQLISMMAQAGAEDYNRRLQAQPVVLTQEQLRAMSQVGKIGFGISYGNQKADIRKATETAIRSFEDGLFRLFINDQEVTQLDVPLQLQEQDCVTVIRLVMLAGGYF